MVGDFLISGFNAPTKDKVAEVEYCVALSASYMSFRVAGFLKKKKDRQKSRCSRISEILLMVYNRLFKRQILQKLFSSGKYW